VDLELHFPFAVSFQQSISGSLVGMILISLMAEAVGWRKRESMRGMFQFVVLGIQINIFDERRIMEANMLNDEMVMNIFPSSTPRRAPYRDVSLRDLIERVVLEQVNDFED
jgi:hypothetical protein